MNKDVMEFIKKNNIKNKIEIIYNKIMNRFNNSKIKLELWDDENITKLFIIIKIKMNNIEEMKKYLLLEKKLIKELILNDKELDNKIILIIEPLSEEELEIDFFKDYSKPQFCRLMINSKMVNRVRQKTSSTQKMFSELNDLLTEIQENYNKHYWCRLYRSVKQFIEYVELFSQKAFVLEHFESFDELNKKR